MREVVPDHLVACHFCDEVGSGEKAKTGPYTKGGTVEIRPDLVMEEIGGTRA